tara:strand:- start:286 stop:459 length:174 start_codon:yes stop_codon:yes gene_type:complete
MGQLQLGLLLVDAEGVASEILGLPVLLAQPIRGMQVEIQEGLYLQDIPAAAVVEPGQ